MRIDLDDDWLDPYGPLTPEVLAMIPTGEEGARQVEMMRRLVEKTLAENAPTIPLVPGEWVEPAARPSAFHRGTPFAGKLVADHAEDDTWSVSMIRLMIAGIDEARIPTKDLKRLHPVEGHLSLCAAMPTGRPATRAPA